MYRMLVAEKIAGPTVLELPALYLKSACTSISHDALPKFERQLEGCENHKP